MVDTDKPLNKAEVQRKEMKQYLKQVFAVLLVTASVFIPSASADIAGDLSNFSLIIGDSSSGLTGWTIDMMGVFLEPPLIYFVTIGIFVTIIGIVSGLLLRRGRRR